MYTARFVLQTCLFIVLITDSDDVDITLFKQAVDIVIKQ